MTKRRLFNSIYPILGAVVLMTTACGAGSDIQENENAITGEASSEVAAETSSEFASASSSEDGADMKIVPEDLGKIETKSQKFECPYCGKTAIDASEEYFVLDSKYSDKADEIKKLIYEDFVSDSADDIYEVSESDCESHEEGAYTSYSSGAYRCRLINDNILGIEKATETDPIMAAHPWLSDKPYYYDLKSGKRLSIKDIFNGTEEEFKDLIAQTTSDYYWANPDKQEQFGGGVTQDTIYDYAYNEAGFEKTKLFLYDDHIELLYFEDGMLPHGNGEIRMDVVTDNFTW